MRSRGDRLTPLGAVLVGMVAGGFGTAAMDALWYFRFRRGGGTRGPLQWEFGGIDGWDDVSAPGQVGRRIAEGFLQRQLPETAAAATNNVVHWAYGTAWGGLYGLIAGSLPRVPVALGPAFGTAVWLSAYVMLPAAGLYKAIWEYDSRTLWKDWTAHATYGTVMAAAFALIGGPGQRAWRPIRTG